MNIITRIQGTTIGAGSFFAGTAVLQVMSGAIRALESGELPSAFPTTIILAFTSPYLDGTERQVIKDVESSFSASAAPRANIRSCSISDPYVLIVREDDTMGLFIGVAGKGLVVLKISHRLLLH